MRCDVLLAGGVASRGRRILDAMIAAAPDVGVEIAVCDVAPTGAPWLMAYGLGHVERRQHIDAHLARGGRLIGWDLPYWDRLDRRNPDHPMRLTLDADHPWRLIKPEPPERFAASGIQLTELAKPAGPVMLVGQGHKTQRLYPMWEAEAKDRIRRRFPGAPIVYRPKAKNQPPIQAALRGARAVVCRHSNVAVDACIAGIPVICEDGAAFALYREGSNPTREQRLAFLQSLAWWQWKPSEAAQAWKFLIRVFGSTSAVARESLTAG